MNVAVWEWAASPRRYLRGHEGNFTRAVSKGTDWAVLGDSSDYGRCVEADFEKAAGTRKIFPAVLPAVEGIFPATEKNLPAIFLAVGLGIDRQGSASKKMKNAANP